MEFDGEYFINRKWDGKGYDKNGNVIYELHNGNGMVRKYYISEELEFEGEYNNGKRNGKGKIYNKFGELIFEGDYLNGLRNGKVKEYYDNYLEFEGDYLNGEKFGKGKEYNQEVK